MGRADLAVADRDEDEVGRDAVADAEDAGEDLLNPRTCIATRQTLPADALIRFVRDPDNRIVPDLRRKLPGRGAHVSFSREAVETAVKRRLFARAFRSAVDTPADLGAMVDRLLAAQATGSLGLARKAGQLVAGAAKVEGAVKSGRAIGLLHSLEAAEDGMRKIEAMRRARERETGRRIASFSLFGADEISLALGGGNVIHAAILAGDAGSAALKRLAALAQYRGENPDEATDGAVRGDSSPEH